MTRADAIHAVDEAFADTPRPTRFIRGTCPCGECKEHEQTMQRLQQRELRLEYLNDPGWDPIGFASDVAFQYLMPGLARLVLEHANDYIRQFLFHIRLTGRLACLTPAQRKAVVGVLDVLASEEADAVGNNRAADDLFTARELLEQGASRPS